MRYRNSLKALSEISKELSSTLNLQECLDVLVKEVSKITEGKSCSIYELRQERDKKQLCLIAGYPEENHGIGYCCLLEERPLIRKALQSNKGYEISKDIVNDTRLDVETRDWSLGFGVKSIMFCPIISRDEKLGVLVVDSRSAINQEEIYTILSAVNMAASRFRNALIYDRLIETNKKLRQREKDLARAVRLATLGEDAAKLSHDIRNPLTAIGGFARRMNRKIKNKQINLKEIQTWSGIIYEEVKILQKKLSNIISFSKGEISYKSTQLDRFVIEILKNYQKQDGIKIQKDFRETPTVLIDQPSFERAIQNILDNACEAVGNGKKIFIKTFVEGNDAMLEIANKGEKIPEETIDKIFEPFYTTKEKGSGLGLAVAYEVLTQHGVNIKVSSTNELTSFIMRIPCEGDPSISKKSLPS